MFAEALLFDASGRPLRQDHRTRSHDWDEVQDFCRRVYMPYTVRPLEPGSRPDAIMHSAEIGRITATRFSYGVPVHLRDFDRDAGNLIVLTTLRGRLSHMIDPDDWATTAAGESFVTDCSRTDYRLDGDADHLQLNLTIPHAVIERTARDWFGVLPDERLWRTNAKFGGPGSAWLALLDYGVRAVAEARGRLGSGRAAARLEEMLCVEILGNWAATTGIRLEPGLTAAAPRYVRRAEDYMQAHAAELPTITEVAAAVGVSVRTLSAGFRRFRDTSPSDFLRERRLQGIRDDLAAARPGETVATVAARWGWMNFGVFARTYRTRFGELPSQTLLRARRG